MKWPLKKALVVIGGSTLLTMLVVLSVYSIYHQFKRKRLASEKYRITALVQTGPEKEMLRSVYLAELLGLSVDAPKNLYTLDLKKAKLALLSSPLIKKGQVKRIPPNTVYVDYEVRKPVAWLADYRNCAMDEEGFLFPVTPFLSPKEMPEIYLGLPAFGKGEDAYGRAGGRWRVPVQSRYLTLAFDLLRFFDDSAWKEGLRIKRIDVSNAFAPTLGRREIVLFTEEELLIQDHSFIFPKILRLPTRDYGHQLQNFFALRKSMIEDYKKQLSTAEQNIRFSPRIVDLRLSQLAFVEN
jgi:hypothetical protein